MFALEFILMQSLRWNELMTKTINATTTTNLSFALLFPLKKHKQRYIITIHFNIMHINLGLILKTKEK